MTTILRAGQVLDSGFEILEVVDLTELEAVGIWARHVKSGAEVFHILNDDKENLFGFAFATAPEDSTGVAHILEHSVLCGSEHYPLKDAFLVLAQGSLQTYLNAWTFPDKTVYPASSVNEQDYFNLMAVYGDAVFRPQLSEWTFMQEGWRLAFSPPETDTNTEFPGTGNSKQPSGGGLHITGVVYNEMKGAYSSLDEYAGRWSVRAVLPGTPYAFDSGGDPETIPELTLEGLRDFHRRKYSPANCRIFLAGNISTEKQLSFLNKQFLGSLPVGKAAAPISRTPRWTTPQTITIPSPAGGEQKSTVVLSWLCGDTTDANETIALGALTEILLGHDGSPLTRLLIESGLGEDLAPATGLENESRETLFSAGLRGVDRQNGNTGISEKIEKLIIDALRRLASEGIPKEEIEAALLSMEFSNREIRRSGGPYSLVWMRRALRSWLHLGSPELSREKRPWDSLLFVPAFTELKRRFAEDSRYFEKLIETYLLHNPHRALVSVDPEEGFQEKKDAALAEALTKKEAALSETERRDILEKAEALEKLQSEGESPEALATIPHLSRKDLVPEIEKVPREILDAKGIPTVAHEIFTNGISYLDLAFPLDILESADYPWFPLFSRCVVSLGLPGMDYGAVSSLLARTTGAFYGTLQTGSCLPGFSRSAALPTGTLDLRGRDWLCFRLKALDEKIPESLDLARRIITEADFSDQRRIRDLVLEMKNDTDSSLAPGGHSYAMGRSSRLFSRSHAVEEIWNGISQLETVHTFADTDTAEICKTLIRIRDTLVSRAGLLANITGNAGAIQGAIKGIAETFSSFGAPRPRNSVTAEGTPFFDRLKSDANTPKAEVLSSSSLQVGFAAVTLAGSFLNSPRPGIESVLAHQLSTGALWEEIRMKGGAYGAFAHPDLAEGTFSLSTYRDPSPLRSLEAFPGILEATAKDAPDEEALTKAVIGSFAKETRPRTGAEKGLSDFFRFLYGFEDAHRANKLQSMVSITAEELCAAAKRIAAAAAEQGRGIPTVIAGTVEAEKAAAKLGVEIRKLPV
ncbi:peptidase, M16 family [Treponema primitia ZAS-2]|uniref:Peptidase, M16 family n=1 Tax=Treponema primitia (strain ATCC BAA-887 / DSM 12427 / ZAS-2) TaxID=545694 RepID=F5YHQ9_TREPZ|nr:insulinase family protein [Treponema primitia]AEF85106.1 peptidase, M16 family [Treponema primitia ZAS-2]